MQQRELGILFIFLYFLAMIRPMGPVISYWANKDYIIQHYCVNKDKPGMNCQGKFHLREQIKENSHQHPAGKSNQIQYKIKDYPIGLIEFLKFDINEFLLEVIAPKPYLGFKTQKSLKQIIHPPPFSKLFLFGFKRV